MKFNEHDKVQLNSGGPVMEVLYYCDGDVFCLWPVESDAQIGSFFTEAYLRHAETALPQEQQVLTDADAAADLAGEPRPKPWTQQRELNLDDDTPLVAVCNITDGTCEACQ